MDEGYDAPPCENCCQRDGGPIRPWERWWMHWSECPRGEILKGRAEIAMAEMWDEIGQHDVAEATRMGQVSL